VASDGAAKETKRAVGGSGGKLLAHDCGLIDEDIHGGKENDTGRATHSALL